MAQAPRWRYSRKSVSWLEKVLTLVIFLVLLGVAGLFLWDMKRPNTLSPFAVDPKLISEAARPAAVVAAGYLLPSSAAARRMAPPQVATPAALAAANASLAHAADAYKPRRALLAGYEVAGSPATAAVLEFDTPEWAFGLWTARKPAQARTMVVGSTSQTWRAEAAAAFWAGKYYVEIWMDTPAATQATQAACAEASANSQLGQPAAAPDSLAILLTDLTRAHVFYGRPFPAETILPEDGLKAESLRFMPQEAFGLKDLKPALLAEYDSGTKVAVVTHGSASQAKASVQALLQTAADADPEGQTQPQQDLQGRITLTGSDGQPIVLQAIDRFAVAASAADAKTATALLDQVSKTLQPAAAGTAAATAARSKQDGPLPKLEGADMTGPGEVRRFNPDTLYEKIDGKAQLYLSYNFAELLFTTYTAGDVALDVYVYDMSQADNAFGIFKAEESEGADPAAIGRGGYYSGSSVFFWKGKYYVNVLATAAAQASGESQIEHEGMSGDAARPAALKLATAIAEQLRDAGQSLWAEQVLPPDNRLAGSFEFRKSDAFGLDFLKDVFSAQYKQDGKEMTLFVTRAASPEAAQEILQQYQAFTSKYGKIVESVEAAGSRILVGENTGTYDVVFARDNYFGGVTAAGDRDLAKNTVIKWVEQLKATR